MTVKPEKIKIGTRGSPLALWQARKVQSELARVAPDVETELVVIKTSGDWRPSDGEVRLQESAGGKGLFAKEIEQALLDRRIDAAVHSMKDMETAIPEGLAIPAMLEREDPRDAFLSNIAQNIDDLPAGSLVGTASVRRASFLLSKRPDLKITPLRGNVRTRIEKVRAGQVDATFLACAGMKRLGLMHEVASVLAVEEMLPSAGQGAIGIEVRAEDDKILSIMVQISHEETVICVSAERAVLSVLDGSCRTPVGVYGVMRDGEMYLRVQVVSPDGTQCYRDERRASVSDIGQAQALGRDLGGALKSRVPDSILAKNN